MKIHELYNNPTAPIFSVELIPPRNGETIELIDNLVTHFKNYPIQYYSVTWGAGGSLRGGTLPLTSRIKHKFSVETMAHLTCLDLSAKQLENVLMDAKYLGIQNILALRGDPPTGEHHYTAHPEGYQYAADLVELINNLRHGHYLTRSNDEQCTFRQGDCFDTSICVACYPEGHPESLSEPEDRTHFHTKVQKGANFAISQMIFDVQRFQTFQTWCTTQGITIPLIPGVYPLRSPRDLDILPQRFHVSFPDYFINELTPYSHDPDRFRQASIALTKDLVNQFLAITPGVHFYSMNNEELVSAILDDYI